MDPVTQEEKRCELPEKGCIRELEDYDEKRECEIGRGEQVEQNSARK